MFVARISETYVLHGLVTRSRCLCLAVVDGVVVGSARAVRARSMQLWQSCTWRQTQPGPSVFDLSVSGGPGVQG